MLRGTTGRARRVSSHPNLPAVLCTRSHRAKHTVTDILDRVKAALADRYTIEHELGAGGMAIVYLATDPTGGRTIQQYVY